MRTPHVSDQAVTSSRAIENAFLLICAPRPKVPRANCERDLAAV